MKIPIKPPKIKELIDKLTANAEGKMTLIKLFQDPELLRVGGSALGSVAA